MELLLILVLVLALAFISTHSKPTSFERDKPTTKPPIIRGWQPISDGMFNNNPPKGGSGVAKP